MDDKIKIDLSVSDETTETKRNSQARDWCFTINNPVQTEQEFLSYLQSVPDLRYVVFQREKAPETGTEHYQGYFEFTQPKWFTTIKKHLSKEHIGVDAHIEARRGKRSQAREYCMDEETRISPQYYEYGEFIEDGERTDLTDIMHDIENGMSFYDLSKKHGNRFIRVMKWAKEYRQSHLENKFKRVFRNMKVYYIYGSAGCGKTSYVFQKHGYDDVYRTTNYEFGWIDDYNGEKILFLDEFRSSFKISEILDYLDGQPIRIRGRHYNRVACYDTVYIVSNLSLKEQYTNIQQSEPKTWAAFCRRITAVYDFDKSKNIPVNKFTGELKKAAYTHRDCRRRRYAFLIPFGWGLGWALSNYLGGTNLKNAKALLLGISVIYFNDESKNIYADLPPNKEQAKRLSKRIYKDAMTAVCTEQASGKALPPACD